MAKRKNVTSREYKVMLLASRFDGDETTLNSTIDVFWKEFGEALEALQIPVEGSFNQVKARRLIRFFDTDAHQLNADQYIVREREDVATGEREVTLKFRHADRYVAADRQMQPAEESGSKTKFEEDVKPPFVSVYSFSTTQPLESGKVIERLRDVAEMFPGLPEDLDDLPGDAPLVLVSDFVGREIVLEGASVLLGKHDVGSECAIVAWYDEGEQDTTPVVVEFSFKYGDDLEDYRGSIARDAYTVLDLLQNTMTEWVDPNPVTKTAFVYQ